MIIEERELTAVEKQAVKYFRRAARAAQKAIDTLLQEHPEANIYNDMGGLCLMVGPSHDRNERPRKDRILTSETIHRFGGGDW